ncbi:hypothetical protein KY348_02575 [Candidatus Woesearchaeota archaeon]|nr:hypothetical protein [Candidatus Woesearchaeota archaeon]
MKSTNYKALFASGIIFVGAGVVFMASVNPGIAGGLIVIGIALMIIGAKNKDKWVKK